MKIGIIGAGQLGRMLALAGYPLGLRFVFLDQSASFALPLSPIHQFADLAEADVHRQLEGTADIRVIALEGERLYTTAARWQRLEERVLQTLRTFHAEHPLAAGMEMEAVREALDRFRAEQTDKVLANPDPSVTPVARP